MASARETLFNKFTANFHNDEDSITRPGALREDLEGFLDFRGGDPPTPALLHIAATIDANYRNVMADYNDFAKSVRSLNATLRSAGTKEIPVPPSIAP